MSVISQTGGLHIDGLETPGAPLAASRPRAQAETVIPRVALCVALMLGLIVVLQPTSERWAQLALFTLGCGINLMPRRWGWLPQIAKWLVLPLLLMWFFRLTVNLLGEQETIWLRFIHRALLFCIFLAPFSRCRSESDLSGFALLVLCVFFFSAAFLHSSFFFVGMLLAAFLVVVAFYEHASRTITLATNEKLPHNVRLASVHLGLAAAAVIVLFLVFPRSLFLQRAEALKFLVRNRAQMASDYSQPLTDLGIDPRREQLQLTNLHELARTSEEVMQVKLFLATNNSPFLADRPLYFRANLYATYRRGAWTNNFEPRIVADADDKRSDGWIRLPVAEASAARVAVQQRIRVKPIGDMCFCLPDPTAISIGKMKLVENAIFQFFSTQHMERDYRVISALPPLSDAPVLTNITEFARSPDLDRYLQLPDDLKQMLRSWQASLSEITTPWALADQIRRSLERDYAYDLGPFSPSDNQDPVLYFLLQHKQGYCTHFATAMTLLARAYGLPARIATGFCIASPPASDGTYVIRDNHAHSWSEIYFTNQGWVTFDATPPAFLPPFTPKAQVTGLSLLLSSFTWLNDFFSEFDSSLQGDIVKALLFVPRQLISLTLRGAKSPWAWVLGTVIVLAIVRVARKLPPRQRRRWRQRFSRLRFDTAVPFYNDFLWLMARAGHRKSETATGREFAQGLFDRYPGPEISWLTDQFYAAKYGGQTISAERQAQAEVHLQNLEQFLQKNLHSSSPEPAETSGAPKRAATGPSVAATPKSR
jgi:transglutaminase-like putative cysteine protease